MWDQNDFWIHEFVFSETSKRVVAILGNLSVWQANNRKVQSYGV